MSDDELLAKGREIQAQLWPQVASGPTGAFPAAKLAPDFYRYVAETAFGMIWSRPGLAIRDRSLVTVAQLAALGKTEELKAHLRGARNVGISQEELVEGSPRRTRRSGPPPRSLASSKWPSACARPGRQHGRRPDMARPTGWVAPPAPAHCS